MFRAMQNITPSHMLDRELYDFDAVSRQNAPVDNGDIAFDSESFEQSNSSDTHVNIIELS